ncbi:hypothetical protein QQ045_007627 [Rhodiola kirilowii]
MAGLETWAKKGRVLVYHEARKVTFENIGRLFASIDPGPLLDEMNLMFGGVIKGVRANPINFPGTAYRHALQAKVRGELLKFMEKSLKKLVTTAVNNPRALQRIVAQIQPRIVSGLESWAEKGRVVVYHEARKVTFENIGRLFASINPGPLLDEMNLMFGGIVRGVRANPINFPGTAYRHALQN